MTDARGPLLNGADRFMLNRARTQRQATGLVLDFSGPAPPTEALRERLAERAPLIGPLRYVTPAGGGPSWRRPRWRPAGGPFVPARHLRVREHADPVAALDEVMRAPLPGGEVPPWDLWLLRSSTAADRFRLCFRVHHALQDGVGAAHSTLDLLDDQGPGGSPGPWSYPPGRPTARGALRVLGDLGRSYRPAGGWEALRPPVPGPTRIVHADVPEALLREAARGWGVSVNDLCLAGLARALRGEWPRPGAGAGPPATLPVQVPMSLRGADERSAPGNLTALFRLELPVGADDLAQAVRRVGAATGAFRDTRLRDVARVAAAVSPYAVTEWTGHRLADPRALPLIASSLTLPGAVAAFGARLVGGAMFYDPWFPLGAYVSFTRAGGVVRCAVVHARSASAVRTLPERWARELYESLAGVPRPPWPSRPRRVVTPRWYERPSS
ncbi:wax ester/triacylglycerol synthase domain-containing protein [Streptomyces uncialis]|uniref:wax ester/triacylglycerol synthase domain-containing protein n=1 Tax=Streptomyces uncialis TaxID=1048205 RepID=UPI0033C9A072